MSIYLNEFEKLAKNKVAYIPIGTIEWHGNYSPIETDIMVAQKICEEVSKEYPGYVLPPFYMGAYGRDIIDGQEMRGMERKLKKKLAGSIYFLKNDLLVKVLDSLIDNLKQQGFSKVVVITGHGGGNQTEVLNKIGEIDGVLAIDPYDPVAIHHADEGEISVLWACYPEEEKKARSMTKDNDLVNYYGHNPIEKSSLEYGRGLLEKMLKSAKGKVVNFLRS